MNKLATITTTLLAVLADTVATAQAASYWYQTQSGLSCQQGYNEGQVSYYEDGALYSDATSWWRTALCPPTDTAYMALARNEWMVTVYDRHYSLDVSCRVIDRYPDGWVAWGPATTSVGSSPAPQTLTVRTTSDAIGLQHLLCYLPPVYAGNRSGLFEYHQRVVRY